MKQGRRKTLREKMARLGARGTGAAKTRGNSKYYSALASLRWKRVRAAKRKRLE